MIHVLIGAASGALLAAASSVIISKVMGEPVTWKSVLASAAGGLVAGAVTTATFGAGAPAAVSVARGATAFALGGASGGATGQLTENALEGRPLGEEVLETAAWRGATGLVTFGIGRFVLAPVLGRAHGALQRFVDRSAPGFRRSAGALALRLNDRIVAAFGGQPDPSSAASRLPHHAVSRVRTGGAIGTTGGTHWGGSHLGSGAHDPASGITDAFAELLDETSAAVIETTGRELTEEGTRGVIEGAIDHAVSEGAAAGAAIGN